MPNDLTSLCMLSRGCCAVVEEVEGREDLERLKALGICIGRTVEVIKRGDPLILKVYGTRIGLSARLAETVRVSPCEHSRRCWEREEAS